MKERRRDKTKERRRDRQQERQRERVTETERERARAIVREARTDIRVCVYIYVCVREGGRHIFVHMCSEFAS